jgi:hypothetical protein
VSLNGAVIEGSLECDGGTFKNPPRENLPDSGTALIVDGARIQGSVFLRDGFSAEGEVRLIGAEIGGCLDCQGGTFKNPSQKGLTDSGRALTADNSVVKTWVILSNGFSAEGDVRLGGARIGGHLMCDRGTFKNPPQEDVIESGNALSAAGVEIRGSVFLRNGFRAEGRVNLSDAHVQGAVSCMGATIEAAEIRGAPESGKAFVADRAVLTGGVSFGKGFVARGEVSLMASQTGDVDFEGVKLTHLIAQRGILGGRLFLRGILDAAAMNVDLKDASTNVLLDDQESWPAPGNLKIDGFVYGRIGKGPTNAETRLRWLALQAEFTPQPYHQLAKVLRESGDANGARCVLYEMKKLRQKQYFRIFRERLQKNTPSCLNRLIGWTGYAFAQLWSLLLKATIGYGFLLQRTMYCILILTIFGAVLFHYGYRAGAMTPTDQGAYLYFETQHAPPPYQQQFTSVVYSLENVVPVLRLGQDSAWMPDPAPRSARRWWWTWPTILRLVRRTEIVCGWLLATLFVAAVTGVARRE